MICPRCGQEFLPDTQRELDGLRVEIERLRQHDKEATDMTIDQQVEIGRLHTALTEIVQGARSLDYAVHVARVALGS